MQESTMHTSATSEAALTNSHNIVDQSDDVDVVCEVIVDNDGAKHTEFDNVTPLLYRVDEIPPPGILVSVALQNILLGLGGALTTAYVISDVICAPSDHPIRAKLFCTTLLMNGLCTALMPLIGIRLPIYQGVCSTFLIPLLAMRSDPKWRCDVIGNEGSWSNMTDGINQTTGATVAVDLEMYRKLREMMGSLILASLLEVIVGATGLIGLLLRFISPIAIATVVALIGLSLYKIPMEYARTHWGVASLCIVLSTIFMLYMDRIRVPIPRFCSEQKKGTKSRSLPIFQMFPILLGILITWIFCGILTAAGAFTDDPDQLGYRARTDMRVGIIHNTPWFYLPYPGQFGSPLFNTGIFVGFVSAVISSILETIGDYYATANLSRVPRPPSRAVNRGILLEGLGSVLSGIMGAGHATTSSTTNLALVGITGVASRSCITFAGVTCIVLSLVGKLGAALSTLPDPIVGGAMFIVFGLLGSIGVFTLKSADMHSTRNMTIFGLSLYVGIVIPEWVSRYPEAVDLGNETSDGIVLGILGNPMLLGGVVAVLLDNTVKGTLTERGIVRSSGDGNSTEQFYTLSISETYDVPIFTKLIRMFPSLAKLPFMQPLPSNS